MSVQEETSFSERIYNDYSMRYHCTGDFSENFHTDIEPFREWLELKKQRELIEAGLTLSMGSQKHKL